MLRASSLEHIKYNKSYFDSNNKDLTSVFAQFKKIPGAGGGYSGVLPYTFTPGKSLLLLFDSQERITFTDNFPDTMFKATLCTICYWENNKKQTVAVSIPASGMGYGTNVFVSEW